MKIEGKEHKKLGLKSLVNWRTEAKELKLTVIMIVLRYNSCQESTENEKLVKYGPGALTSNV